MGGSFYWRFSRDCRVTRAKPSDSRDVEKTGSRENKTREVWGKGKCAFSLLSYQGVICISFHIAEHYSLGAWNRLFVL